MARVLFSQQNTVKTAKRNSRINFYFVTSFYSLYDICIADTNNQQIEYELWVPLRGTKVGWGVFAYPTAALLQSLQWVSDRYVSPRDTALMSSCLKNPVFMSSCQKHSRLTVYITSVYDII